MGGGRWTRRGMKGERGRGCEVGFCRRRVLCFWFVSEIYARAFSKERGVLEGAGEGVFSLVIRVSALSDHYVSNL